MQLEENITHIADKKAATTKTKHEIFTVDLYAFSYSLVQ